VSDTLSPADEDTGVHIQLAEARTRLRAQARDIRAHDGKIETMQGQVARLDERVKVLTRVMWAGMSVVTALSTAVLLAVLRMLGHHP